MVEEEFSGLGKECFVGGKKQKFTFKGVARDTHRLEQSTNLPIIFFWYVIHDTPKILAISYQSGVWKQSCMRAEEGNTVLCVCVCEPIKEILVPCNLQGDISVPVSARM